MRKKFKKIINNSKNSPFLRNIIMVVSGTALSQIITMLFSPILTRLYGPESMGILGVFNSVILIAAPVAALTFPTAIVLPKKNKEAKQLMVLSLYISVLMSLLVFFIFFFWKDSISNILQLSHIEPFLLLVPILMLFYAGAEIINQWLVRNDSFNILSKAKVIDAVIKNLLILIFGLFIPTATSLIIITTFSKGMYLLVLIIFTSLFTFSNASHIFNINKGMFELVKKYREFPLYRAPQAFINSISSSLPILILTILFGPQTAGFYSIGNTVLQVPVNLIGNSVGNVFYPRASKEFNEGKDITKLLVKITFALVAIGFIPFMLIILYGPSLFSFVFGEEWTVAGIYARWIGVWVYTSFISRPAIKVLPIINAQKFHLIYTIITIIFKIVGLIIGGMIFENDFIAIALYGLVGASLNIFLIAMTIYKSKLIKK